MAKNLEDCELRNQVNDDDVFPGARELVEGFEVLEIKHFLCEDRAFEGVEGELT